MIDWKRNEYKIIIDKGFKDKKFKFIDYVFLLCMDEFVFTIELISFKLNRVGHNWISWSNNLNHLIAWREKYGKNWC